MLSKYLLAALGSILAQNTAVHAASSIDYLFTFGDSYSQTGFDVNGQKPSAANPIGNPPFPGWTAAGGANWVGDMVKEQNNSLVLSYNFAYGGATVDANIVKPYTSTVLSMVDQVNQFSNSVGKHPAGTSWTAQNTIAGVWIGVNDVGNSFYLQDSAAVVEKATTRYFELLQVLYKAGLRKFVLLSVPPTELTPLMIQQGTDSNALLVKAIKLYNSKLASKLSAFKQANSGVKTLLVDTSVSFKKAINDPKNYGAPDATCFNNDGKSCLWFNDYHPGIAINRLVAEQVANELESNGFGCEPWLRGFVMNHCLPPLISHQFHLMTMCFPSEQKVDFQTFRNVIHNQLSSTSEIRHGICPSTEEPLWESPVSTQDDVDRAVSAAKAAYPGWRKLSWDERASYLVKFADAIEAHKKEFVELLGREAGKPPQAGAFELMLVMEHIRETPKLRIREEKPEDNEDRTAVVRYVPLGVGVGIVPWNFPMLLGIGKAYPAMLAGNTFIWKPSPYTPYSALKLAEIGAKVLPPGVFQALSGGDDLGPMLTAHPDVAKIMAACASTLKRVTLELGGNDAAIICEDVDIPVVAGKVAFLAYVHCGQICMNIKRIYVHESIYDKFLSEVVKFLDSLRIGDFSDPQAFFGPIQNKTQYEKLQRLYEQIDKQGWKRAFGSTSTARSGKGYFMPPVLIDNPPEDSEVVQAEPFGPIVPVMKWQSEDDVIRCVNASVFGLGASVWSRDVTRARRMAEQLEAGSIWVNTHFEVAPNVPFGGHKQSGIGMDWGEVGLKGWCNPQAYWVKHSG
ncbi:Aldehyde/histidinol dehydrogenase [Fusarium redolens]|uniref:aldehyde dehydrogenase (NAD(+)) n=1 Tax=Fusarium redolens TaxID=48865 RepID=A0A9P9K0E0_FUSRE|nr:Aldehyde/histidinol dehydrogenase [Fusarium redolens]KAH7244512.1 Aldehyde/histidinol dehydrogenase [Fusarium redolens]